MHLCARLLVLAALAVVPATAFAQPTAQPAEKKLKNDGRTAFTGKVVKAKKDQGLVLEVKGGKKYNLASVSTTWEGALSVADVSAYLNSTVTIKGNLYRGKDRKYYLEGYEFARGASAEFVSGRVSERGDQILTANRAYRIRSPRLVATLRGGAKGKKPALYHRVGMKIPGAWSYDRTAKEWVVVPTPAAENGSVALLTRPWKEVPEPKDKLPGKGYRRYGMQSPGTDSMDVRGNLFSKRPISKAATGRHYAEGTILPFGVAADGRKFRRFVATRVSRGANAYVSPRPSNAVRVRVSKR
jgi:hypothetical protein